MTEVNSKNLEESIESKNLKAEKIFRKADEYETPLYLAETLKPHTEGADASRVSKMVLTAVRWVVAMDYYNETIDIDYDTIAKEQRQTIDSLLTDSQKTDFKLLEQNIVDPYWIYEADIKKQILDGHMFSDQEVEESIMRRSGDSLLYGALTSYEYSFPSELIEVLHVRQAMEDIEDCMEDYEEDLKELEPNIFFLYFLSNSIPRNLWPIDFESAKKVMEENGILSRIVSFMERSYKKVKEIPSLKDYPDLEKNLDNQYESLVDSLVTAK